MCDSLEIRDKKRQEEREREESENVKEERLCGVEGEKSEWNRGVEERDSSASCVCERREGERERCMEEEESVYGQRDRECCERD